MKKYNNENEFIFWLKIRGFLLLYLDKVLGVDVSSFRRGKVFFLDRKEEVFVVIISVNGIKLW